MTASAFLTPSATGTLVSSPRSDGGARDGSKPNEVATVMSQDQRLQDFIVGARRLLETPRL